MKLKEMENYKMYKTLVLFLTFFMVIPLMIKGEIINKPVINIYRIAQDDTEVETQAIYGAKVEVLEKKDNQWVMIKTFDQSQGWVKADQITADSSYEKSDKLRPVKNLFAHIYRVTDTTPFPPLLTLPYGAVVKLEETEDTNNRWIPVELVSGEKAWIQRGDIDFSPKLKSLEETIAFSKKFLGLPYTWGGTSSFGYDCSGFVQMLFKEMGFSLPRNSRDQAESSLFVSVEKADLQPGDLIFFGASRVTHVGIYLGNDEFIHSGVVDIPVIKISTLSTYKTNIICTKRLVSSPAILKNCLNH